MTRASSRRMHVAFFNRSYYPDVSATGQLLTDLCEDLAQHHGCRVSVVTGPPLLSSGIGPAPLPKRETRNGVEILRAAGTRMDKSRFTGRATNYMTYFATASVAGLRLDRPDVVVALTDPPVIGIAAWMASRRFKCPLVMSYRDLFPEVAALLPDFHSDTVNGALQRVNRFLCRRATRVVALGDTMRARLIDDKGAPADRTLIISDWADTAAITPKPKRNPFSEAHGLADAFVVMHSGNLGLSQQLETLVDAAAELQDLTDLRVVLVGEGVKKADLQAQAKARGLSNVVFLPFTPREHLADAFATADVFVVSLQRGLAGYIVPSKLYGILAAGRPYVAAVEPACEVASLTERQGCGTIAEPGDARALAARIREFYGDRALLARCGDRARAASAAFDRRTQVAKYAALFQALVTPTERVRQRSKVPETSHV